MTIDDQPFHVLYVGAGEINFGSAEGPWSHSLRLENAFGPRLNVLGIVDPDLARARSQLAAKNSSKIVGYASSQAWKGVEEAATALGSHDIGLVIIGTPPHFRGGISTNNDLDLRLLQAFPHTKRWLVEKPVSAVPPSLEAGQEQVCQAFAKSGAVVGVGYMLQALKAVEMIKSIIAEKQLVVMGTQARYYMAYEYARKPAWWNKQISCGPVVEQATHLASLSLAFGGRPNLSSVRTHTVEHNDQPGKLSKIGIDETLISPENRVPRYTNSIWTYDNGGVGSLVHVVALHDTTYDTEFEVICDGHTFKIVDMYTASPKLFIRSSRHDQVKVITFEGDDPFQTQIDALVAGKPICSYEEALLTYKLTWAIRAAGEKERDA